jgi:hypothetical protein
MDSVRFLSFLQDFAASAASNGTSSKQTGDGNTSSTDLASTLSAFETQLKALMVAPTPALESVQPASTPSKNAEFVTGGNSKPSIDNTLAATESMLAMVGKGVNSSPNSSPADSLGIETPNNDQLREIIAWRREQIDPMLHVKVGDIWERQGITDPLNHPKLIADARHSLDTANFRKAHMPGFVAQWEGPWRTTLAAERQANSDRQIQMAAASAASGFITGGGRA